jgi:hypothetical protein
VHDGAEEIDISVTYRLRLPEVVGLESHAGGDRGWIVGSSGAEVMGEFGAVLDNELEFRMVGGEFVREGTEGATAELRLVFSIIKSLKYERVEKED